MNLLTGTGGEPIDIVWTLGQLRPGAEFHWQGDMSSVNDYDAIGEWRDGGTTKPTAQEIIDEWNNFAKAEFEKHNPARAQAARDNLIATGADAVAVQGLPDLSVTVAEIIKALGLDL